MVIHLLSNLIAMEVPNYAQFGRWTKSLVFAFAYRSRLNARSSNRQTLWEPILTSWLVVNRYNLMLGMN